MEKKNVLALVSIELIVARHKHPKPWRNNLHAALVLLEEVWEVMKALVKGDKENLKVELAQVSAVCQRWLEDRCE